MEDSQWEARRTGLIADIERMPPCRVLLRDGDALIIRSASANDAELVHSITHQAFMEFRGVLDPPNGSDSETVEDVSQQIRKGGAFIGYLNDSAVASLRATLNQDHLYIGRVGVIPPFRSKGIGRAMIRHADQVAKYLDLREIRLGTREKLAENVSLYLSLGYSIDRVLPHSRGSDNVVLFVKQLDSQAR